MFLTPDELTTLTGYTWPAKQRQWLTARGWVFEVAATGKPIVSAAYAEQRLGGIISPKSEPAWKPNLAAIRKVA